MINLTKTIKVIDLLNKIANGEEVPKRIKYKNEVREYVYDDRDYVNSNSSEFYLFYGTMKARTGIDFVNALNDEVEIIEDTQKEDKKIDNLKLNNSGLWTGKTNTDLIVDKINEIIDKINEGE